MPIQFNCTKSDIENISRILDRVDAITKKFGGKFDRLSAFMDLDATHSNGCPMDFASLAGTDDFNLMHDVNGIARHIDRQTGKLGDLFHPRFALKGDNKQEIA